MALRPNEVAINKVSSTQLEGTDLIYILMAVYHTPELEAKRQGDKSWYKYIGYVDTKDNLQAKVDLWKSDAYRIRPWKMEWPVANWNPDWFLATDGSDTFAKGAKWLALRISKVLPWKQFVDKVTSGIVVQKNGRTKQTSGRYQLDSYFLPDGTPIDPLDIEQLKASAGKPFTSDVVLKRGLPKIVPVA